MAKANLKEAMERITRHARAISESNGTPYEEGREILGLALSVAEQSSEAWALWLLWGGLTDCVENKPEETGEAEGAMVRAAKEWLILSEETAEREQYFDRWLYEEIGYERPPR